MMRRMMVCVLPMALGLCSLAGTALAYDLSRQDASASDGASFFIDAQAGLWIPGPDTFNTNHNLSPVFGAELGFQVLSSRGHQLYVVFGGTFSPQSLAEHLIEEDTSIIVGFGGVRYIPGMWCSNDGSSCPFIELALGLTWETAEDEGGHGAPQGEITLLGGIGYQFNLGEHLHAGVRIDLGYLEEASTSQLGWFIPAGFLGAQF